MCFVLELKERFNSAGSVAVLSQYSGTRANSLPNPSSVSMFEQNPASYIAKADPTSSTSMVDMAVRLCRFDMGLTGAFASIIREHEVDFPLSGLMSQMESEKAAGLKTFFL